MANAASLGIDVGSTSVKACLVQDGREQWSEVTAHDGNLVDTVREVLTRRGVGPGIPTVVTGREGRRQFRIDSVIEPVTVERAIAELDADVQAVVSVGGEDLVVYTLDKAGRIVGTFAGNKCASGTGEFFAQQLKRMDLGLEAVFTPEVAEADVHRLSARCSVFMKSDCTHKLNKGEADKHDIVLSLSNVMARKVLEFLAKARIDSGRVLLAGGSVRNPHLVRFLREGAPGIEFVVPPQSSYLEAFGAAHLAAKQGLPLPEFEELQAGADVVYARTEALQGAGELVKFVPSRRGTVKNGATYVLGVDGGSTTTKVALIDPETKEIVASFYGRTLGDPVVALRQCLREVRRQIAKALGPEGRIRISLVATTGSSRELLGVYCGTQGVYNEIIAHTVGTTFFDAEIDTIFEIGGQDAKYVHLRNNVPVDYAMNEACSAGTGSFLEESAAGDLDIHRAEDIGPVALKATNPLRFGEHCSAFINSDIRKAIQQGAGRPDIVAGLALSIVSNYLNRVVGNRRIGNRIVLQGGVAKNPSIPLAFASLLGKPVVVPPDPELMGAFGVALLAMRKNAEGALDAGDFTLDSLISREMAYEKEYRCKACDNLCPIRIMRVDSTRYHFGGRCNKYANLRKKVKVAEGEAVDYVEERRRLYFEQFAPDADDFVPRTEITVGVPEALSVHSLWPLYSNFFHAIGVKASLVPQVDEKGVARCESSFCYPVEIAHGQMGTALDGEFDYWFLPHFKAMPSYQEDIHACLCPLTQALPYYLKRAFHLDEKRMLAPVLDLRGGFDDGAAAMAQVAVRLGFTEAEGRSAWSLAVERQKACYREQRRIGATVLAESVKHSRPVVVLFGRPYNALTAQANMGIPRKFTTRGCTVLPFDFIPIKDEKIDRNMYWYYGQADLKGAVVVKDMPNVFACYITNFSCAPDSFILHYNRWIYNTKPFLVLELDSHTADAGIDTRVEAFLDIVESYRKAKVVETPMMIDRDWDVRIDGKDARVVHRQTGETRSLKDPRVRLIWPSMGRVATQMTAAVSRSYGIDSVALPPADVRTAQRARAVASGKECIPALLVLGAFLEYFAKNPVDKDRVYLLFMPLTTGPCRTGQYAIFYQNLFQELGYRNVVVLSLNADNSYTEFGPDFSRRLWKVVCISDYLRDIEGSLAALAENPKAALAEHDAVCEELIELAETGIDPVMAHLPAAAERIARIPLAKKLDEARKVLVVGEIFVRRDDYSVGTLIERLAERHIVAKVTGLSEWIHYLDWEQVRKLRRRMAGMSPLRKLVSPEARELLSLKIEMVWKWAQEAHIRHALAKCGLVPESPEGMERIMKASEEFASTELESEATLSPGSAAVAMKEGYDGAAIIAPFACLPGRIIEAIYAPWARERHMPVVAIENDGNPYPPGVVARIEVFAHNVSRGIASATSLPVFQPVVEDAPGPACHGCAGASAGCTISPEIIASVRGPEGERSET